MGQSANNKKFNHLGRILFLFFKYAHLPVKQFEFPPRLLSPSSLDLPAPEGPSPYAGWGLKSFTLRKMAGEK